MKTILLDEFVFVSLLDFILNLKKLTDKELIISYTKQSCYDETSKRMLVPLISSK